MLVSQVNKFLIQHNCVRNFFKFVDYVHDGEPKVLYPLTNRALVKVSGNESSEFLQGLITNDMKHFENGAQSIYAMFLNSKGRVLYDTLIHRWSSENIFLLECDKSIHNLLEKHLKMYKLRRNVSIRDVTPFFDVWAMISPPDAEIDNGVDVEQEINVYRDPRLEDLGHRIITTSNVDLFDLQDALGRDTVIEKDDSGYQRLKYSLGVSEGAEDLFPGDCLPLEANCDYLHGVSFQKGCYIGQELTARVHHTGVVRKRIMPLKFTSPTKENDLERDSTIWSNGEPGRAKVGKLKNFMNGYGIGLVRIKEALESKELIVGVNPVEVTRPHWWPVEAPKEKSPIVKPDTSNLAIQETS